MSEKIKIHVYWLNRMLTVSNYLAFTSSVLKRMQAFDKRFARWQALGESQQDSHWIAESLSNLDEVVMPKIQKYNEEIGHLNIAGDWIDFGPDAVTPDGFTQSFVTDENHSNGFYLYITAGAYEFSSNLIGLEFPDFLEDGFDLGKFSKEVLKIFIELASPDFGVAGYSRFRITVQDYRDPNKDVSWLTYLPDARAAEFGGSSDVSIERISKGGVIFSISPTPPKTSDDQAVARAKALRARLLDAGLLEWPRKRSSSPNL